MAGVGGPGLAGGTPVISCRISYKFQSGEAFRGNVIAKHFVLGVVTLT